ncbi:uncharacterized protein [Symphalangus syndactylus]|uniref:uncharacterized protein n=1 Tax=Symphalangus syndactylus TaxID=9590 RepID=UPI002442AA6C|nr:uncharacterized protein LOC129480515 [Symphalangus syndactylus]
MRSLVFLSPRSTAAATQFSHTRPSLWKRSQGSCSLQKLRFKKSLQDTEQAAGVVSARNIEWFPGHDGVWRWGMGEDGPEKEGELKRGADLEKSLERITGQVEEEDEELPGCAADQGRPGGRVKATVGNRGIYEDIEGRS